MTNLIVVLETVNECPRGLEKLVGADPNLLKFVVPLS